MEPDPAPELLRQPLFTALTRPQMFAGVTYGFFIINVIITMELFLVTKSFWVIVPGLIVHFIGRLACLEEPRIFDLWLLKVQRCPRLPSWRLWRCNSYQP